ncbi:MAG: 2-C-methyl-D-erythritol 4-phosphate cytidylyltransferase [Nitrospirae bacterium]|nr:2-C-methyl-D-erythritol 4-phosphate cytidylyltransferase [Nitrospirota bacterium]
MAIAIVPAAGIGARFGKGRNKTFYTLLGKPVVIWPLETLQEIKEITEIIPVVREGDMKLMAEYIEKYNIKKIKKVVAGGRERQDSVYNGIREADSEIPLILIHDGVRPFIEKTIIKSALRELLSSPPRDCPKISCDGIAVGVPVKDTIKETASLDNKEIFAVRTLDRNMLWAIQTPQIFYADSIRDAHEKAAAEKFYATDDAALIERYGGKVKLVMGSYRNIKITTPEDIYIAEGLMRMQDT